jgi:hypothetical protein
MGDHALYVRFPDGTIRHGLYQSTADIAFGDLVDTFEATQCADYYANRRRWDQAPPDGAGVPVEVATVYGGGFAWRATATPDYLTSCRDPWEGDTERTDGIPPWLAEHFRREDEEA